MTWLPSCNGLPVELATPSALQVDFAEIAHALSHLNRSSGNSMTPVSVGLHTLIGLDLCPTAAVRAHWLLHDCHEARLGDVTTPMKEATRWIACDLLGGDRGASLADMIDDVRRELENRHDAAIYAAAGLARPDPLIAQAVKRVDLRALATERRDFYRRGPSPRAWAIDGQAPPIDPGPKVWRWLSPVEVSDRLIEAVRIHLPALQRGRRAS